MASFEHPPVVLADEPLNRTQPYISDSTVGDSAFGQVFAGGGGETLQLDARIEFKSDSEQVVKSGLGSSHRHRSDFCSQRPVWSGNLA